MQRHGLHSANYDAQPFVAVPGHADQVWDGWREIAAELRRAIAAGRPPGRGRFVLAVETVPGVLDEEVIPALREGLRPDEWVHTVEAAFRSPEAIDALVAPDLGGDDPVFGRLTRLTLEDFFDPAKVELLRARLAAAEGLTVVYGPGALRACRPDLTVYADMARWELQRRQRANRVSNLGVENRTLRAARKYQRSFFVDGRVCDRQKRETHRHWDYLLDTCAEGRPKMITARALAAGLDEAVRRPFRLVPFFDPGVWGGQWMREVCSLPEGPPNYAWCFDCVPEENSLRLGFGAVQVEIPSIHLVFFRPVELLGEPVYGRTGAEFPIRFDFLDTMGGQNLSLQVHPLLDYAREHFGLSSTQDESYYLLDAEPGAVVYLGVKDDVDRAAMLADLEIAQRDPSRPFPDERHVARFAVRPHDHFLIPAGTCHASGRNSMVLEISHTPYLFTFKMWDWGRLDLDGRPRPIHLERGRENLQWNRNETWCRERLVNAITPVASGPGWREEKTGLDRSESLETRRHWFTGVVAHDTRGESVHVLNLVQGQEAEVASPTGAFAPFVVHYAETFVVPAAVGRYTLRPHGQAEGTECATIKAFMRVRG
ncbi:MAG: mannose-6-phosphate isomerase [Verrucomicrobia bacterium]|nr:mannose-6-phosphate isomerase [Pseudomonadota bacterium]NBS05902.1 mannose-6-phosphate isomerase [Verrucomicrobiota bacterium]NBS78490.1 mannose-6-phosphate isomerase [bacterium]NBS49528.1 mannose-6-phosphate isomerase [Verrucomicrobiota bacterium]NBV96067.1 mannose-6-phosphate isomerase [Verrucomicrobiota bacterium]